MKSDPAATITWLKNGKPINNKGYIYLYKKAYLRIYGAHYSDDGKFTCIAKNTHGSVSADAYIAVITRKLVKQIGRPLNIDMLLTLY